MMWMMANRRRRIRKGSLMDRMNFAMEERRLYLDRNLCIESFAHELSSNRTYIYGALRSVGMNFTSYINSYRTQYAIDLLLRSDMQHISVNEVADMSGFSTARQMNFYIKRSAGVTARALRMRTFGD